MITEKEMRRQARINRPRDEVWTFMTTLENAPKWIEGVKAIKQTSPGPMGPGAKLQETRTLGRYTETYEIEVREFEPPRRYAAAAKAGKAEFVYAFELADAGGATDITMVARARGEGLVAKLFLGMGFKMMEKYDGDQVERLRAAVEGKP